MNKHLFVATLLILASQAHGATYQGKVIDGQDYPCKILGATEQVVFKNGLEKPIVMNLFMDKQINGQCNFDGKTLTIKASMDDYGDTIKVNLDSPIVDNLMLVNAPKIQVTLDDDNGRKGDMTARIALFTDFVHSNNFTTTQS